MDDLVVLRLDLLDRHLPARGGRRLEHLARRGPAAAHGFEEMTRAARAVGVLVAEALFVARSLYDAHALPVGLELVGHDHWHARAHALSHLGTVADDADDTVGADRDEHQGVVDPAVRHAVGAVLRRVGGTCGCRESDREREPTDRGNFLQKTTPADIGDHQPVGHRTGHCIANQIERRVHAVAPCLVAACLMAARMRA